MRPCNGCCDAASTRARIPPRRLADVPAEGRAEGACRTVADAFGNFRQGNVFAAQQAFRDRRAMSGPSAFYDSTGKLLPQFQVHMDMLARFSADLHRLNAVAKGLRIKLQAQAAEQDAAG